MNAVYTILLLVCSNIFMTLAWYGHLKLQQTGISSNWPLIGVILFSWVIAFAEYCCQVPANRIGFDGNGGPFNLMQLKVIQEVAHCIHDYRDGAVPRSGVALEPSRGFPLPDSRCLFRFPLMPAPTETQLLERRIWRHFSKGLTDYRLLDEGDRILIGLSGGKDSLALLEFMARRARIYRPHIELAALHVRMTNIAYESDTDWLERFAAAQGVRLIVRETGFDPSTDTRKSPCFLCSWNRRKTLFTVAQELGCNKIALGHHQDDILHTTSDMKRIFGQIEQLNPEARYSIWNALEREGKLVE